MDAKDTYLNTPSYSFISLNDMCHLFFQNYILLSVRITCKMLLDIQRSMRNMKERN